MDSMLRANGLGASAVEEVVAAARSVFDPRRLRSLQPFLIERTVDGALRLFEYEIDNDSFLRITKTPDTINGLRAEVLPIPKTLESVTASGEIGEATPSLFQSIEAAGEGIDLAIAMAEIFAGEIDFNTDLQPGDRYSVTVERFRREGRPNSYGVVTAARFENDGRVLHAFRFTTPGSKPDYYDENGRSLRRFFLRSPLKFVPQVTSGFSARRMHPVLHTARAHRGVDYAAPSGAPVVSIAAAASSLRHSTTRTDGWCGCAMHRDTTRTTCTCRRSRPASKPVRRSARVRPLAGSVRPDWRPDRICITAEEERGVRESTARTSQSSTWRSRSCLCAGGLHRGARSGARVTRPSTVNARRHPLKCRMAALAPFCALRPAPSAAARVAAVPYDVVNADEARALAAEIL
jgi:hypothetical protein